MFSVLHSSAGAGKTHALVKHYLTHCLAENDPGGYRQVLALTFTSKAAGEMKERVLEYLERMAAAEQGNAQIDDVVKHVAQAAEISASVVPMRAAAVLTHMLHHWGDVAIGTIDSFTRRVVRPFARDLQLDHDLQMTTEEDHYRGLAVEALIAEAGVEPTVTGLLTEACLQLLHEERKWDPEKPLRDLSKELGRENAIGPLALISNLEADTVMDLSRALRREETVFCRKVNALGEEALDLLRDAGIEAADMASTKRGIHGYYKQLSEFPPKWEAPGVNKLKPLENGKWHSGKASHEKVAALDALSNDLTRIFLAAEELRTTALKTHLIRVAVNRELLSGFALHALNGHLERIKHTDGVAFFSDLTRKVAQVVRHEPVPFIHERMGERYRHFLIDEFQDTSLLQWNALLPLIDNALATDGSALLVGDAKQAIYRWRNGEVRLFTHFPALYGRGEEPVEKERERTLQRTYKAGDPLNSNWRSGHAIIEFNNALFGRLSMLLSEDLRTVYDGHAQKPERASPGLVQMQRLDKDVQGDDPMEALLDLTLLHVNEALADGHAPGDIAVLVRNGVLGRAVAGHLINNGHAVVSPDGLQLSGDPVIELLVDLLRFLHTGEPTAAARVLQYQAMLAAPAHAVTVDPFGDQIGMVHPAERLQSWLKEAGDPRLRTTLTALVARLAQAHGLRPAEDAQVLTLLDELHAWTTVHGQDLGGFLEHWERSGSKRSVTPPEHGQAVQVMTIHKSKGLQFPVVIVPNANMSGRSNHGERFWIDPGSAVPELPVALVRESSALRGIELPELMEEDRMRLLDAMNLLYVAFTRAEQRLYALVPANSADAVTKELLAYLDEHGTEGQLMLGSRDQPWKSRDSSPQGTLREVSGPEDLAALALRLEAPAEWDPADPDPYRRAGNAIHEVLARTLAAPGLADALDTAVGEGLLTPREADALARNLAPMLASASLSPWYGEDLTVRTEATLVSPDGSAHRPDRVVFDKDVVRVLDIKTGKPNDSHHEQVRGYMRLLGALGHARVEGALLYVPDGQLIHVEP